MKLRVPETLAFLVASVAASSLYACGIELEGTAPVPGSSSSSSGSSGAGTSSSGGSTSGASTSSSSGAPSGSSSGSSSSSGDPTDVDGGNDGGTCTTTTIRGDQTGCLPAAGFTNGTVDGRKVSCARGGTVPVEVPSDALTAETFGQEGAFWVEVPLSMTEPFVVTASVAVQANSDSVGAGFGVALVTPDPLTPADRMPGTGGSGAGFGITGLSGFSGVAAVLRNYTKIALSATQVPNAMFDYNGGASSGVPAREDSYRIVIRHTAGATTADFEVYRGLDDVALTTTSMSVSGTAVESGSAFVGVTAGTGAQYTSIQRLVSLTIERCTP